MATPLRIAIQRLPHAAGLPLPSRETDGAAGWDVRAAIEDRLHLGPGERALVPTGFAIAVPPGFECQVRPRSGWALRHGVTCLNAPGTIDSDYRGEVKVLLVNHGQAAIDIERGMRIAQLVFVALPATEWEERPSLEETDRAAGGFGHTGN